MYNECRTRPLDVLLSANAHLNEEPSVDPADAIQTRAFWDEVDRAAGGTQHRELLVEAHVLCRQHSSRSQRELARRLGRSYKGLRMHLAKLRARLRSDEYFRETYGYAGCRRGTPDHDRRI